MKRLSMVFCLAMLLAILAGSVKGAEVKQTYLPVQAVYDASNPYNHEQLTRTSMAGWPMPANRTITALGNDMIFVNDFLVRGIVVSDTDGFAVFETAIACSQEGENILGNFTEETQAVLLEAGKITLLPPIAVKSLGSFLALRTTRLESNAPDAANGTVSFTGWVIVEE